MLGSRFFYSLMLFLTWTSFLQAQLQENLLQNIESREKISLDGAWKIIVDPLENGYYNHRYQPKKDGYFLNKKMKSVSDLIEYDFDTDATIKVPGDWTPKEDDPGSTAAHGSRHRARCRGALQDQESPRGHQRVRGRIRQGDGPDQAQARARVGVPCRA